MFWKSKGPYTGPVVECVGIERTYTSSTGPLRVLRGLDMRVEKGQLVALYGPSGSGKTTLLNLIGALDRPTAGVITIDGKDITRMRDGRRNALRRRFIGFIFQNYALLPTYTAFENIDLALRLPRLGRRERHRRALAALEAVGLGAWANHVPDEMSGGQRKRIAIARALALRPRLILADEPTGGLDTRTTERIMTLFRDYSEQQGTTFIIVSHDPLVSNYVDQAYDLVDGKVVMRPPPELTAAPHGDSDGTANQVPAAIQGHFTLAPEGAIKT